MENKNQSAFPNEYEYDEPARDHLSLPTGGYKKAIRHDFGLTKREYIAAKVLPECIGMYSPMNPEDAAKAAVQYADALLAELEK